jgi:hypothetical protein
MTFEESLKPFPYGKGSFFEEFSEYKHEIMQSSFIKRNRLLRYFVIYFFNLACDY